MTLSGSAFPFEKATIHQLMIIVRYEECPADYKNAAMQLLILIKKGAETVEMDRAPALD